MNDEIQLWSPEFRVTVSVRGTTVSVQGSNEFGDNQVDTHLRASTVAQAREAAAHFVDAYQALGLGVAESAATRAVAVAALRRFGKPVSPQAQAGLAAYQQFIRSAKAGGASHQEAQAAWKKAKRKGWV